MTTTVRVDLYGTEVDLSVYQKSKSVWIARGDYKGQSIEGKGRSPATAAASWRERARYSQPHEL